MKQLTSFIQLVSFCIALAFCSPARAANYDISITETGFDPSYLVVQLGDTVTWWNDDFLDYHSTRSYSYPWSSGWLAPGEGVFLTARQIGTFDYLDESTGEFGTLVITDVVPPQPPPPPVLTNPSLLADGTFQCTVSNLVVGKSYIIEASTDLSNWTSIYNSVAFSTSETYSDTTATTEPRRFYHAIALP